MSDVIVGVDPHKKSVTIEAIDEQGKKLATGRFGTATRDYKAMLGYVRRQWPHHRWAGRWRSGCSPTVRRWSTSRPSSRHGSGSSTPATPGRPTPPTPTRSRPQHCAPRTCGCSRSMRSWSRCGC
jgi:hypothetical protein